MDNYIQLRFEKISSSEQEILIAQLSDIGFDGFEQGGDFLLACIPEQMYDESLLKSIPELYHQQLEIQTIAPRNWNDEWEKSFEPVIIENFCAIRASFHPPVKGVQHEIIITPKMSFGTGHHATTFQVIQLMEQINFKEKSVLDFGTGTGVLAILAEKSGARNILAIDNDEWSIDNVKENIEANQCSRIKILLASTVETNERFDVILANINKHIILQNLPSLTKHLQKESVLILSGLLKDDEQEIVEAAFKEHLVVKTQSQKYDWIALSFSNVK